MNSGLCAFLTGCLLLACGGAVSRAATNDASPDFQEIYQLIQAHSPNLSESDLNRAAVKGLLAALGPKASLVATESNSSTDSPAVSKTTLFDDKIGYVRIAHVGGDLASELSNAFQSFSSTNKLNGLVLDLRYADGSDYAAAGKAADLFISKAQPLLSWGQGSISSEEKTNAIQLPVTILVNGATSGSAEALAAVLRSTGAGLILGSKTAGEALVAREFPLKNGEQLRLATAPVTVGNGTTLSTNGVKPDIEVTVNPEDEHAYYADSFFLRTKTNQVAAGDSATNGVAGTNGTRRTRFDEAELVREHRAGLDRDSGEPPRAREPQPEKPLVSDPALARALDLLKGLAVVRQSRS